MNRASNISVVPPGKGRNFTRLDTGDEVIVKLAAETSRGSLTIYQSSRRAGDRRGPSPHRHNGFEEIFYVLTGKYIFEIENQTIEAPTGMLIFVPAGKLHTFTRVGEQDGCLLVICEPGGIEQFFEDVARHSSDSKSISVPAIALQHGIEFMPAKNG